MSNSNANGSNGRRAEAIAQLIAELGAPTIEYDRGELKATQFSDGDTYCTLLSTATLRWADADGSDGMEIRIEGFGRPEQVKELANLLQGAVA